MQHSQKPRQVFHRIPLSYTFTPAICAVHEKGLAASWRGQKRSITMKTITIALVAALIGSTTMSASAMSRAQVAAINAAFDTSPGTPDSVFDPFHQIGFNGNRY